MEEKLANKSQKLDPNKLLQSTINSSAEDFLNSWDTSGILELLWRIDQIDDICFDIFSLGE